MATWFRPIATLASRCSKVSSFTFVICFVSKVMPYFNSTVLCLLISGALIEFNLFDPSRCSVVTFYRLHSNLGSTATYRCISQLQCMKYRIEQNYDIVPYNIIYTSNFPVPVYRASLNPVVIFGIVPNKSHRNHNCCDINFKFGTQLG